MKLTELDIPARPAEVVDELEADSIHIARLPRRAAASSAPAEITQPPALTFVTDQPRRTPVKPSSVLALSLVIVAAAVPSVLIASSAAGGSAGSHKAAVHLTPAEQRAVAATRARAAAIAKAKRDRGTDAEWGDTIPALTPPPSRSSR